MITIIGAFLIISACIMFTMKKISEQQKAIDSIRGLKDAFLHIARKMEFEEIPVADIMKEITNESYGEAANFFKDILKGLTDGKNRSLRDIWYESLDAYIKKLKLSESSVRIIKNVGTRLGKMAQNAETDALNSAAGELDSEIEIAEKELLVNSRLLKSGGILVGIFIVIIFI